MKYDLPPLIEADYPPEMAYFECIHEAKLIVDLICKDGIQKINTLNSNFAEWDKYDNDSRPLVNGTHKRVAVPHRIRRICKEVNL